MGGTTAKICLIEDFAPKTARTFDVARTTRFARGSGMPISVPPDRDDRDRRRRRLRHLGRCHGAYPDRAGIGSIEAWTGLSSARRPAITGADLALGEIDPDTFAGGAIRLWVADAEAAIDRDVGNRPRLSTEAAAFGIGEVVDENMADAARVHAVENGKDIADNVLVAFGGPAPLHAARLCEKLGIGRCPIPPGAGGFRCPCPTARSRPRMRR